MPELSLETPDDKKRMKKAAIILCNAEAGKITASGAMKMVGYPTPSCMNRAKQKSIIRMSKKIESTPPSTEPPAPALMDQRPSKWLLEKIQKMNKANFDKTTKQLRMTSRQAQVARQKKKKTRLQYDDAVKYCTTLYAAECCKADDAVAQGFKYDKMSADTIVKLYMSQHPGDYTLCGRTIRKRVQEGKTGHTPTKPGEKGRLPPAFYNALMDSFVTFVKLTAHHPNSKSKTSRPSLTKRVNAVVNLLNN